MHDAPSLCPVSVYLSPMSASNSVTESSRKPKIRQQIVRVTRRIEDDRDAYLTGNCSCSRSTGFSHQKVTCENAGAIDCSVCESIQLLWPIEHCAPGPRWDSAPNSHYTSTDNFWTRPCLSLLTGRPVLRSEGHIVLGHKLPDVLVSETLYKTST